MFRSPITLSSRIDHARAMPRTRWLARALVALGAMMSVFLCAHPVRAQGSVGPAAASLQAPFATSDIKALAGRASDLAWQFELAQDAMHGGFHELAEQLFLKILQRDDLGGDLRVRATLGQVDALIGQGRGEDAATVLQTIGTGRDDAWHLRRGITHFLVAITTRSRDDTQRREYDAMFEQIREIRQEALGRDSAWWYFLRSTAANRAGEQAQENQFWERAIAAAVSDAERSVLRLARVQASLTQPEVTESSAATLLASIRGQEGKPLGLQYTLQYAVVLDRLGDKARAVSALKRQRQTMPEVEHVLRDQTLLVLGLVAGAESDDGRQALRELLEKGHDPDFQRVALLRLASTARVDAVAAAADLRKIITALIDRPEPHPLIEDLLLHRAKLDLQARLFESAEADARALLTRFPGSSLKRDALAVLASSSWQRPPRFRTAADYVAQIRAIPEVSASEKARLALMQGECYFRAGLQDSTVEDFRNAAEAYAAAYAGGVMVEGVAAGTLFFQRVISLIRSGAADAAMRLLDDIEARAGVDEDSRWQAEWNFARALQMTGRSAEALRRVDAMGPAIGVSPELQLRFLWLAAQVSLDTGRPDETEARVARVREFLDSTSGRAIDPALRIDVLSNAGLVAAEARLVAGDREGGQQAVKRLREDFPNSPAADYSFIVESGFLAEENKLVEAMQLLLTLADTRRDSKYAPVALYQAALLNIRLGQETHLNEASRLLDQMASRYPAENFDFPARLKQADVMRRLGRYNDAETIYRSLESKYPNHPDRAIVQISLADALMAQATNDPSKFQDAVSRLERLMAAESLPVDLRAEAGVKLGAGWQTQGNPARAAEIYWEIYRRFLEDASAASGLGATGPHWIARALFALGEIEERENRFDNARRLYQALLDHGLPGDKVAQARILRITAPASGG